MNDGLIADIIANGMKTFCLGVTVFTLAVKWRQAKRAGENPRAGAWPYALFVVALIVLLVPGFAPNFHRSFSWICLGLAMLLGIIGTVAISRQRWQLDKHS